LTVMFSNLGLLLH